MKTADDYRAKIRRWAEAQRVVPLPSSVRLPKFSAKRFRSHDEMNRWKQEMLREMARQAVLNG